MNTFPLPMYVMTSLTVVGIAAVSIFSRDPGVITATSAILVAFSYGIWDRHTKQVELLNVQKKTESKLDDNTHLTERLGIGAGAAAVRASLAAQSAETAIAAANKAADIARDVAEKAAANSRQTTDDAKRLAEKTAADAKATAESMAAKTDKAIVNIAEQTTDLHKLVNSRLDELLAEAREAAYAKGKADGLAEARAETKAEIKRRENA